MKKIIENFKFTFNKKAMAQIPNRVNKLIEIFKYRVSRKFIDDEKYCFHRMQTMLDDMIYWKHYEKNKSVLGIEREFCKNMVDMYFKRFMYYKNKID